MTNPAQLTAWIMPAGAGLCVLWIVYSVATEPWVKPLWAKLGRWWDAESPDEAIPAVKPEAIDLIRHYNAVLGTLEGAEGADSEAVKALTEHVGPAVGRAAINLEAGR